MASNEPNTHFGPGVGAGGDASACPGDGAGPNPDPGGGLTGAPAQVVYTPMRDVMFRKMISSPDHLEVLQGFLKDFWDLEVPLHAISIIEPYSADMVAAESPDVGEIENLRDKLQHVNVDVPGHCVVVEIQPEVPEWFFQRAIHRASSFLVESHGSEWDLDPESEPIGPLRPVLELTITGGQFQDEGERAFYVLGLMDTKSNFSYPGNPLRIGVLELGKRAGLTPAQEAWRHFFETGDPGPNPPPYLLAAASLIQEANLTPEEKRMDAIMEASRTVEAA
jgi:hypothetical protein